MENVIDLISDSRLLAAKEAYDKILENPDQCIKEAELMRVHEKKIATMTARCAQVDHAMDLVASQNPNWTLATNYLGVTTHYMLGDDGLLWVRMESTQSDIPVVEQMAVVYEVEWFKLWIPFCSNSRLIARLSHTELIAYTCISAPLGICRESVVYAFGVDCIYENGSLVVLGESIEAHDGVDIPPCKGLFNKRATLQFSAVVTPYSPTSGHMIVVAKVDPKLSLPQTVLNFVTKQLAGFFLVMIYQQAREIVNNDDSPYRAFIQENRGFYVEWLLPRIRAYFDHQGWTQPVIACLGEDGYPDGHPLKKHPTDVSPGRTLFPAQDPTVSALEPSTSLPILIPHQSEVVTPASVSRKLSGRLHKKGSALFYSVWSHRHFDLDVCSQTLQWFKCSDSSDTVGVKRGEISLSRATAVVLANSKKSDDKSESGVRFVVSYYKENSAMPHDMFLSAPSVVDACLWIAHINKAGTFHETTVSELSDDVLEANTNSDEDMHAGAEEAVVELKEEETSATQEGLGDKQPTTLFDSLLQSCGILGRIMLFLVWFFLPLYPLILHNTLHQQIAYVGTLYVVYVLPTSYNFLRSEQ